MIACAPLWLPAFLSKKEEEELSPRRLAEITVLRFPNIPRDLLAMLARDKEPAVRREVAGNTSTPRDLPAVLSEDLDAGVRQKALQRL
jgi:hypothetical protein